MFWGLCSNYKGGIAKQKEVGKAECSNTPREWGRYLNYSLKRWGWYLANFQQKFQVSNFQVWKTNISIANVWKLHYIQITKGITADYVILGKLICIKTLSTLLSQPLHESSCTLIQVSFISLFIARVVKKASVAKSASSA